MAIIFLIISAIGLAGLTICVLKLISPFIGWHSKYAPSITEMTVDVPKAGRYSINIRRDRFWLWKGYGTVSDTFPKVNFSIQNVSTGENIQFFPSRSLMTSRGTGTISVLAGYFDVSIADRYLLTTLPESRFLERDEILIRKHLSFFRLFLLIWGIVLCSLLFLGGLILGVLILSGNLDLSISTLVPGTLAQHIN